MAVHGSAWHLPPRAEQGRRTIRATHTHTHTHTHTQGVGHTHTHHTAQGPPAPSRLATAKATHTGFRAHHQSNTLTASGLHTHTHAHTPHHRARAGQVVWRRRERGRRRGRGRRQLRQLCVRRDVRRRVGGAGGRSVSIQGVWPPRSRRCQPGPSHIYYTQTVLHWTSTATILECAGGSCLEAVQKLPRSCLEAVHKLPCRFQA
jgi:hypothetical protein